MSKPTNPIDLRFEAFVRRLTACGVASPSDLVGCSADEIERLERKYRIVLPASYRLFLQTMGRGSGRLFTHDHVSVHYPDILDMTEEQAAGGLELPSDALIISAGWTSSGCSSAVPAATTLLCSIATIQAKNLSSRTHRCWSGSKLGELKLRTRSAADTTIS